MEGLVSEWIGKGGQLGSKRVSNQNHGQRHFNGFLKHLSSRTRSSQQQQQCYDDQYICDPEDERIVALDENGYQPDTTIAETTAIIAENNHYERATTNPAQLKLQLKQQNGYHNNSSQLYGNNTTFNNGHAANGNNITNDGQHPIQHQRHQPIPTPPATAANHLGLNGAVHLAEPTVIPPMPPLNTFHSSTGSGQVPGSNAAERCRPLTIAEYEKDYRTSATDLQLMERVFRGGLASNKLRASLWPYLFGLVEHRGRFERSDIESSVSSSSPMTSDNDDKHDEMSLSDEQSGSPRMRFRPTAASNGFHLNSNFVSRPLNDSKHNHLDSGDEDEQSYQNNETNNRRHLEPDTTGGCYNGHMSRMKRIDHNDHGMGRSNGDASKEFVRFKGADDVDFSGSNNQHHNMSNSHNNYHQHHPDEDEDNRWVYIEHEMNIKRWRELESLYNTYLNQWQSITPDQERRNTAFRERKALIERDVIRSDRSHSFYADKQQNLQAFNTLLLTYVMHDTDIGYLQGMSDLAAPILYMFEGHPVKAFWVFTQVMRLFRRNFESSQKTIHFQLECLYRLIKMTDSKFAQYLREIDCSNCFFAFRCIVCQFKRELMKGSYERDYCKVLTLWDTIWSVQTRHELLTNTKSTHTFTVATNGHNHLNHQATRTTSSTTNYTATNGYSASFNGSGGAGHLATSNGHHHTNGHCRNNRNNYSNHIKGNNSHSNSCSSLNNYHINNHSISRSPKTRPAANSPLRNSWSFNNHQHNNFSSYIGSSPVSSSPAGPCSSMTPPRSLTTGAANITGLNNNNQGPYYVQGAHLDPEQADVTKTELTETEKFVLSLCLALIRRERNSIMSRCLDATEIHQHFINPNLADDLDSFIGDAYQVYQFLQNQYNMDKLVKKAGEALSPPESQNNIDNLSISPGAGTAGTADTYDLLSDYLIISPTFHDEKKPTFKYNNYSWDNLVNNNNVPHAGSYME